jgi:hypothetical protein
MSFVCEYCKKEFARETSIAVHMCEPKRRRMQQDEAGVRLGFQAYIKFYETMQGSAKNKTYDDFCESAYYKAFVKFGRYCVNTHVINPPQFMNWLLKNNKKIDRWCSDQIYTEYLTQHLLVEAVDDALKRAIEHSIRWEETTGHPAKDMLRYGNANALCYDITAGRISPWVIYNSQSGIEFLGNLSTEQVAIVWPYINSDAWHKKFNNYPADQEFVKDILTQAGW